MMGDEPRESGRDSAELLTKDNMINESLDKQCSAARPMSELEHDASGACEAESYSEVIIKKRKYKQ